MVSLLSVLKNSALAVIAAVGHEGILGISLFMGGETTLRRAVVQRAGLIRYSRGHICVIDRPGLEREVCECYNVVKKEFDRLLRDIPRGDARHTSG